MFGREVMRGVRKCIIGISLKIKVVNHYRGLRLFEKVDIFLSYGVLR